MGRHKDRAEHERKRNSAKPKKKDKVKQAAGRKGAEARWRNTLSWHRQLEELRGGKIQGSWKQRFHFVALRYVFLRHTLRKHGPWKDWPIEARRELAELAKQSRVELRLIVGIPGTAFPGFPNLKLGSDIDPWTHIPWRAGTLEAMCRVTQDERVALMPKKVPKEPTKTEIRRIRVAQARSQLSIKYGKASVRKIQEFLRVHYGTEVSIRTVFLDLKALSGQQ